MILLKILVLMIVVFFAFGLLIGLGIWGSARQLGRGMNFGMPGHDKPQEPQAEQLQKCPHCGIYSSPEATGRCRACGKPF